jgi:hypothetical protein
MHLIESDPVLDSVIAPACVDEFVPGLLCYWPYPIATPLSRLR